MALLVALWILVALACTGVAAHYYRVRARNRPVVQQGPPYP